MDSNDYLNIVSNNELFTTQSLFDLFDNLSVDLNNQINNDVTSSHSNSLPNSIYILNGTRLETEFGYSVGYTDTQVQIIHKRHFDQIRNLLNDFYKFKIPESDKSQHLNYSTQLTHLNNVFRSNETAILTKYGMQYCNDIYNWYEKITRHINNQ